MSTTSATSTKGLSTNPTCGPSLAGLLEPGHNQKLQLLLHFQLRQSDELEPDEKQTGTGRTDETDTHRPNNEDESRLIGLASGLCFDFNKFDSNIFLLGTEEGKFEGNNTQDSLRQQLVFEPVLGNLIGTFSGGL